MVKLLRRSWLLAPAVVVLSVVTGCATGAPRTRPVKMGPVAEGAGTLDAVRHQLQGAWNLVSLDIYPPGGKPVQLKASGTLVYDEFGNLSLKATVTDSAAVGGSNLKPTVLSYTGRAVIDVANKKMILADIEGNMPADRVPPAVAADRARYYEFVGDRLTLSIKDDQGRTTATLVWQKGS